LPKVHASRKMVSF